MKRSTAVAVAALAAAGLLAGMPAFAQFAKAEDAIKHRKAAMTLLGSHMGRIGAMVRGDKPFNAADVQANAAIIETVGKVSLEGFVAGSEQGGNTRAKPDVWSQADKFHARGNDMQKAIAGLASAAKAGAPDGVKAAFGEVGKSCKACHDDFQAKH